MALNTENRVETRVFKLRIVNGSLFLVTKFVSAYPRLLSRAPLFIISVLGKELVHSLSLDFIIKKGQVQLMFISWRNSLGFDEAVSFHE